jgi:hypothetical protein
VHVIVLRTVYDLMSSVTIDMTRIFYKFLYFDMLNGNLRNCRNKIFLSFDFTIFNIMICPMTICTIHSCFLYNCLRFMN